MKLEGIDYMNDDPSQVNVLYGQCVDVSGRLQRLADSVVDHFEARGLLDREYERVKLHVTLMNTKFTASSSEGGAPSRPNRRYFNAKSILEVLNKSIYLYIYIFIYIFIYLILYFPLLLSFTTQLN